MGICQRPREGLKGLKLTSYVLFKQISQGSFPGLHNGKKLLRSKAELAGQGEGKQKIKTREGNIAREPQKVNCYIFVYVNEKYLGHTKTL